ncbi:restriction endonuclease subunit S [Massilia aquatica]|uniref:Restriction endonuclease subunit S n=1 Tax=Massilia aquatica TaxID=2609000 RepID=A0ABX0MCW4_9BURK|nr:restriction endonuclease subunit S [Massilia aquatica]NHZ45005.1 restriction endonuclease subunit S [Massilia aquatica]
MSKLPNGWTLAQLGDLVQFNPKTEARDDTNCGFVPMASLGTRYGKGITVQQERIWAEVKKAYTHFKDGDVLVAKVTPCFENGKAGIARKLPNGIGAGSSEFCVFRPMAGIDGRYLLGWLSTKDFRRRATVAMTGSVGLKRVPKDVFLGETLPVAPPAEQRRIANKLDDMLGRVDVVSDRLARVAPLLTRLRQSILVAATSGKLTFEWRLQHPTAHVWKDVSLVDVAGDFGYGSAAKSSRTGTVPVLRMGNIQSGNLDWTDLVYTSAQDEIAKYDLRDGDVLFNRTNSPELVGKSAIFRGERRAIFAGYLIRVRCGAQLLPDFLNYNLCSPAGREYCWKVKSDGVSQSNINAVKLRAFKFKLPGTTEQAEIVRRVKLLFAYVDQLETRLKAAQTGAERLVPSLLAKAFRGELVPQDPRDEPANALLRRLQAAPAPAPVKRGRRRVE